MDMRLSFSIVGGDTRSINLAQLLSDDGYRVFAYALEEGSLSENIIKCDNLDDLSRGSDCLILPTPVKREGDFLNAPFSREPFKLSDIFSRLPSGQIVIGGKVENDLFELAGRCGIRLFDCVEREDFSVMNAVPTAEGAIAAAMEAQKTVLCGSNCLVLGFGRIGKLLCHRLYGLGAKVTASARKAGDLAWISAYGFRGIKTSETSSVINEFDIIFNTIPSLVLDRDALLKTKHGVFICDLASAPGGVDFEAARMLNIRTIHALSLPGKVAPETAAEVLRNTVYNILDEWGK